MFGLHNSSHKTAIAVLIALSIFITIAGHLKRIQNSLMTFFKNMSYDMFYELTEMNLFQDKIILSLFSPANV